LNALQSGLGVLKIDMCETVSRYLGTNLSILCTILIKTIKQTGTDHGKVPLHL